MQTANREHRTEAKGRASASLPEIVQTELSQRAIGYLVLQVLGTEQQERGLWRTKDATQNSVNCQSSHRMGQPRNHTLLWN